MGKTVILSFPAQILCRLIILASHFKVALRVAADGADLRCLCSHNDVTAVSAFPDLDLAFFKDSLRLNILKELAIPFFVCFFDRRYAAKLLGKLMEAFLIGILSHTDIHIRPFGIFSFGSMQQILRCVANLSQCF